MTIKLKTEERGIFGKKLKNERGQGKLPAVFYGKGRETISLFVNLKEFKKIWKQAGESSIVELEKDGKKMADVLIHDVNIDPIKNEPLHADFYAIEMDKSIKTKIHLDFEGVSPAVKELGAILIKVMHDVEIEALPKNLPHEIKIDITKLTNFGDHITVDDINPPHGVKILAKKDEIIAIAEEPKEEVEEKPISIEEIEVERKGKKPAEGEAAEEISE